MTIRRSARPFVALALAFLIGAPLFAQGRPRAVIDEPIVDVGVVAQGEPISHGFVIRNEGDAPLRISQVKPSCGCTVTEYPESIGPGEAGDILAVIETTSFRGPIAKSVRVFTNDVDSPRLNLVVKANIKPQIEVQPSYARFIVIKGEEFGSKGSTLWSADKPDLQILDVKSPFPFLKAEPRLVKERDPESDSSRNKWKVDLTLMASAPIGPMADFVIVRTNHPSQPEVRIPVSGFVRPPVAVIPSVLDFGARQVAEPYPATVEVKILSSSPITVSRVVSDLAGVDVEIEEVEAGRLYNLLVTLQPGAAKGRLEGSLQVYTSSPLLPVVNVPVKGRVL